MKIGPNTDWGYAAREVAHDPLKAGMMEIGLGAAALGYGLVTADPIQDVVGLGFMGYGAFEMGRFVHKLPEPHP